jgi:hypothetical protein
LYLRAQYATAVEIQNAAAVRTWRDAVQKRPGPIQYALPRADTGHKDSTLPLRTPTYQS